jgi:hypothetical protein
MMRPWPFFDSPLAAAMMVSFLQYLVPCGPMYLSRRPAYNYQLDQYLF